MNINDYRKAMDHISPSNELKERIMHKKTTHRRYAPVHRVLASTLIAVLMLTCVTTVAWLPARNCEGRCCPSSA